MNLSKYIYIYVDVYTHTHICKITQSSIPTHMSQQYIAQQKTGPVTNSISQESKLNGPADSGEMVLGMRLVLCGRRSHVALLSPTVLGEDEPECPALCA